MEMEMETMMETMKEMWMWMWMVMELEMVLEAQGVRPWESRAIPFGHSRLDWNLLAISLIPQQDWISRVPISIISGKHLLHPLQSLKNAGENGSGKRGSPRSTIQWRQARSLIRLRKLYCFLQLSRELPLDKNHFSVPFKLKQCGMQEQTLEAETLTKLAVQREIAIASISK